tara:strand:- start:301 stop:1002 length:702 start_codon:yes stop_codon:yes gene_type:complete
MSGSVDFANSILQNSTKLRIMDLRPKTSAVANRATGHGYELSACYPTSHLSFHNISNIHAIRESLNKVNSCCTSSSQSDVNFSSNIEDSKWLLHTKLVLQASWQAAFVCSVKELPVLVHCSHGWDRTSQVCALAQIFLDPFFRTCKGFRILVEKDWLAFGHPFQLRCGHGESKVDRNNDQLSPIFIQFIDCVWQLLDQFPDRFEFNARYLLMIADHVLSCRFGTFLFNTEQER